VCALIPEQWDEMRDWHEPHVRGRQLIGRTVHRGRPVATIRFPGAAMSLTIGTSLAAHAMALECAASSSSLDDRQGGLAANAAGSFAGASVDDEVQVVFEDGQLRAPLVVAPLWSDKAEPPTQNAGATSSQERVHPASAAGKSDPVQQVLLEVIGGTAASVAFVVGAFSMGPTAGSLLAAYLAGLGPRD
jgi:hypothetical protein